MILALSVKNLLIFLSPLAWITSSLTLGVLLIGVSFWRSRRQSRSFGLLHGLGFALVCFSWLVLMILGNGSFAQKQMYVLESEGRGDDTRDTKDLEVPWIVVLGGGVNSLREERIVNQVSSATLFRVVEGCKLWHENPSRKIVFSGMGPSDRTEAAVMAELASSIGVAPSAIVLDANSTNTSDQALAMKEIVGKDAFFLVTDAAHQKRSIAAFQEAGLKPIRVPVMWQSVDALYTTYRGDRPGWWSFQFPEERALIMMSRVLYERVAHERSRRLVKEKMQETP